VLHKIKFFSQKLLSFDQVDDETMFPNGPQRHFLRRIHKTAYGSLDMSYRVEHALSPWVNFFIMPIFALANAGVEIPDLSYFNILNTQGVAGGVGLGIFLGLVLGKPLGITLFSFLAIKTRICTMPDKARWGMFFAVACLGGIGFTMSIFVDTLSFADVECVEQMRNAGKIAILVGSLAAGVLGSVLITAVSNIQNKKAA
jgi:NhaA family Na+:H+ antiporter